MFTLLVLGGLLPVCSATMPSNHDMIADGYAANNQALLITTTGDDTYRLISSISSSGSSGVYAQSANYRLASSFGEPALPNNQLDLMSQGYRHQPGFLVGAFGKNSETGHHVYLPLVQR